MTPQEIIQKFAAREEIFRQARNNYVYTQDITIQELDGDLRQRRVSPGAGHYLRRQG